MALEYDHRWPGPTDALNLSVSGDIDALARWLTSEAARLAAFSVWDEAPEVQARLARQYLIGRRARLCAALESWLEQTGQSRNDDP